MCFIVARCPGRSVLKAVRRLKPEKPTKRLLTRRWRTIRISKGQLSLSYLTLPAKEIRLGPTILRYPRHFFVSALTPTRRLSKNSISPPHKQYFLTRSELLKVIKVDTLFSSFSFFLYSKIDGRNPSTFSFQICFFLFIRFSLPRRLGPGIFRRDWLDRQWRQGARSESKGNRP